MLCIFVSFALSFQYFHANCSVNSVGLWDSSASVMLLQFLSWNMHFCFVYSIAITLRNNIYIKSSFLGWHLFSSSLCIILFVWELLITTELNFMSSQLVLVYCQVNLFDRRHQWLLNFYASSWKDTIWFSEYQ